jgi:hypothetical protein
VVLLVATAPALAQEEDARAMAVAKETLDRGAALFDERNAAKMAATFLEAGQLVIIRREPDGGRLVIENRSGRTAIEESYRDLFKDRSAEHKSRNTVESARFLGNDMLLVRGRFSLDRNQGDSVQFVQVRALDGGEWKVATMQILDLPK